MNLLNISNDRAWALLLWILFLVFVLVNRSLNPVTHAEVFLTYRDAASLWWNGQPLYDGTGTGFVYFPQSAVLMTPFTFLSPMLDSLVWRVVDIAVFALGAHGFSKLAEAKIQRPLLLPVTLISIILAASAAKLGQMTLIMAGLLMVAVTELEKENWWRCAVWLILAFALKPLAAPLVLLVSALYPRTIVPLLSCLAGFIFLPFILQDPVYVWSQYQASAITLQQVAERGKEIPLAQVFWMLREAGIDIPDRANFAIRSLFAVATLSLCWWLQRRLPRSTFLVYLFSISSCYMLLFNPTTENNTYALLGPAIGVFAAWSFHTRNYLRRYDHTAIAIGYLLSNRIGKLSTGFATVWAKPLLCCIFLVLVIHQSFKELDKT